MAKLAVIGCGFVGLTLAVFASNKFKVIGFDIDKNITEKLNCGKPHFFEPNLEKKLKNSIKKGLKFKDTIDEEIVNSDFIFVTVGTPSNENGEINTDFIKQAAKQIGKVLKKSKKYHIIIIKSTVVPTTTNKAFKESIEKSSGKISGIDFGLIMNPEFLREGSAIYDTENPHLIVIGSNNDNDAKQVELMYKILYPRTPEIIFTNIETAEMIKYANNTFLATKISFINTIANICQKIPNTDINVIANAIGKDPRIGQLFLQAGPGYGGSCFPKDVSALISFSKKIGYEPVLINATKTVNNLQVEKVLELIENKVAPTKGKVISVLGLAFKKDTDDIRESVSIKLIKKLLDKKMIVNAHDPMAVENTKKIFGDNVNFHTDVNECLKNSNVCVIMTDWNEYKVLKPNIFRNMKDSIIIDTRRVLDRTKFKDFIFVAIGNN